jgi:hypothetical protein
MLIVYVGMLNTTQDMVTLCACMVNVSRDMIQVVMDMDMDMDMDSIIGHTKCPSLYVKSLSGYDISLPLHGKCNLGHGERIYEHDTSLLEHG